MAADDGTGIGWAALDWEEREALDGDEERITAFKIASFGNDRPEAGFRRGFMVLFVKLLDPVLGAWGRVGMGQIWEAGLFEEGRGMKYERLALV